MVSKKLREKIAKIKKYPFVSVCTPTFNRRPFITSMIECFNSQDYPKDRLEWIIIDDGTDKIEDLVKDIKEVKYFKYDTKMSLGRKRNLLHEKSIGSIIVYMDDDDYYPPQRISHAVQSLIANPKALCAGSSEIYIYFNNISKMYQFGPYGPNHATAGTFAFRRELLKDHEYENHAALAEEKAFLKNYTVPFVQLDPLKTILVFSHKHNTFDKTSLLTNLADNAFVKESDKTVDMFISNKKLKDFFMNKMDSLLNDYEPGRPCMKPDVLKQTRDIEETRRKANESRMADMASHISIEVSEMLQRQQKTIIGLVNRLKGSELEIERLTSTIEGLKVDGSKGNNNILNPDVVYY
jgi:glycosyltransferase involved in cell wall biosynthesis